MGKAAAGVQLGNEHTLSCRADTLLGLVTEGAVGTAGGH